MRASACPLAPAALTRQGACARTMPSTSHALSKTRTVRPVALFDRSARKYSVLVIKPEWAQRIITGDKIWEIRSGRTEKVGQRIGISMSGSSSVCAWATLKECHGPLTEGEWRATRDYHRCTQEARPYGKRTCAWEMRDIVVQIPPLRFTRKRGAVIWDAVHA